ncbi:hypothetical protein [Pseudochryseolinea flava]|nr:hypothetical protein [Pseudochryseolinea flava]
MEAKKSLSPLLIVVILLFTFPIWIGIVGGAFGIVGGVIGGFFGIITGIFGTIFGIIGGLFGWIFNWSIGWPFCWDIEVWAIMAIVAAIIIASKSRKQ